MTTASIEAALRGSSGWIRLSYSQDILSIWASMANRLAAFRECAAKTGSAHSRDGQEGGCERLRCSRDRDARAAEDFQVLRRVGGDDAGAGGERFGHDEALRFRFARHHERVAACIEIRQLIARDDAEENGAVLHAAVARAGSPALRDRGLRRRSRASATDRWRAPALPIGARDSSLSPDARRRESGDRFCVAPTRRRRRSSRWPAPKRWTSMPLGTTSTRTVTPSSRNRAPIAGVGTTTASARLAKVRVSCDAA